MQFDPNEIVGHIACVEAGDEAKPEGVFTSKHNEKTAYMFRFNQACTISKEQLIKELQETELNKEAQGPLSYYVLRDLYNGRYCTICPDGIYKYNVLEFLEAPVNDIREALNNNSQQMMRKTVLNTATPVLAYWEGTNRQAVALKIPPVRFRYKNIILGINEMITLPPVVYKVTAVGSVIEKTWVCVIAQDSMDLEKLELARLPFPNIYEDAHICVGSSRNTSGSVKTDIISLAHASWDMFINSSWNVDLLRFSINPDNLEAIFSELKDVPDILNYQDYRKAHRQLIAVLREPDGYSRLKWKTDSAKLKRNLDL